MNILHTESSLGLGGQEFRVLNECVEMQRRGHKIFLVLQPESQLMDRAKRAGVMCLLLRMNRIRWGMLIASFLKIIAQYHIDIISTHGSIDSWTASIAGRLSKKKPIIVRNRHKSTPIRNSLRHRLLYHTLPHAIVTTGEQVREDLIQQNGVPESKIVSIPTGVNLSLYYPRPQNIDLKKALGVNLEDHVVGMIAFLRDYKGVGDFLQAAQLVLEQKKNVRFLIVGEGPQKDHLSQTIRDLSLGPYVSLLGFRADIPDLLSFIDVMVLSSLNAEGVPQVLTQALAMERGVVATQVGSVQELIRHRETGLLVNPGRPQELALAIDEVLQNTLLQRDLGRAGRKLVVEKYGLSGMIDKTLQLYDLLLNAREHRSQFS